MAEEYLEFLQNDLTPVLATHEDDCNILGYLISIPLGFSTMFPIRKFLHTVFPERWIGRSGSIGYLGRCPDFIKLKQTI